jgi:hypothetical protein
MNEVVTFFTCDQKYQVTVKKVNPQLVQSKLLSYLSGGVFIKKINHLTNPHNNTIFYIWEKSF